MPPWARFFFKAFSFVFVNNRNAAELSHPRIFGGIFVLGFPHHNRDLAAQFERFDASEGAELHDFMGFGSCSCPRRPGWLGKRRYPKGPDATHRVAEFGLRNHGFPPSFPRLQQELDRVLHPHDTAGPGHRAHSAAVYVWMESFDFRLAVRQAPQESPFSCPSDLASQVALGPHRWSWCRLLEVVGIVLSHFLK